jgi:hypothetical protein
VTSTASRNLRPFWVISDSFPSTSGALSVSRTGSLPPAKTRSRSSQDPSGWVEVSRTEPDCVGSRSWLPMALRERRVPHVKQDQRACFACCRCPAQAAWSHSRQIRQEEPGTSRNTQPNLTRPAKSLRGKITYVRMPHDVHPERRPASAERRVETNSCVRAAPETNRERPR